MSDYLMHHGIKDQKWYRRRFQNKDGSLTPAGKRRYGKWEPAKKKNVGLKELKNVDGSKRYAIESEDGTKVGNISTYHQSDDSLRVSWIGVENKFKRDGYASSAMEKLKEDAIKNGYKKMSVVIPKDKADIQHIYERLGFKSSNANLTLDEFQDSITTLGDVVKMELDLTHSDELMHYGVSKDNGAPAVILDEGAKATRKNVARMKEQGKEVKVYELSKEAQEFDHWVDELLDEATHSDASYEELYHYGVGHLHGGHSGRYPWGSGKDSKKTQKVALNSSNKLIDASELNDAKTIMSDMDDFFKKYRERPDHDVSKEREEIFDKIENNWLSTSSGSREMRERMRTDPEFKKRVISACDLGLKGLDEMNGPGYVDWDAYKERPGNQREWFAIEDQTVGMLPIADLINRGYTGEQVGKLIDFVDEEGGELRVKENRPGYGCYFDVTEGWADELKPFARACERVKNKEINHSDLLDDFLAHYGVGPDDDPPGRGSGRYAKGTGKDPYQHDPVMKKKMGLFDAIGNRIKKFKEDREETKRIQKEWDEALFKLAEEGRRKEKRLEALAKARETRKANKEKAAAEKAERDTHEAEKQSAIASGDPERISKFLSEMSNQEQRDAITRISQMKTLNDSARAQADARARAEAELAEKNRPRTKAEIRQERIDNLLSSISSSANKIDKLRDAGEKFIKAYNLVATVNNSLNSDKKLKKIDFGNNDKKDDKKDK